MTLLVDPTEERRQTSTPIPLSAPLLAGNEWDYVKSCLDSSRVSSAGAFVPEFEQRIAGCAGALHGVATSSGTAALHIALLVLGVGQDDEVIGPTLTFIATANAIRYTGAHPLFVDCDPVHWQMDPGHVTSFLRNCDRRAGGVYNRRSGRRIAAILPVHVLGHPADMSRIVALGSEFDIPVVEDATEALGSLYNGQPVGGIGRIGCFSFNGNKLITTGGGGMVVTNEGDLARRARHLTTQARTHSHEYIHDEVGFNYRLTNVQAAIGCGQAEKLESFLERKRAIAHQYNSAFTGCDRIAVPQEASGCSSNWWLYTIRVLTSETGASRRLIRRLGEVGIEARPIWQPLHRSPAHSGAETIGGEIAERIYLEAVSLPSSVGLSAADQDRVIEATLRYI